MDAPESRPLCDSESSEKIISDQKFWVKPLSLITKTFQFVYFIKNEMRAAKWRDWTRLGEGPDSENDQCLSGLTQGESCYPAGSAG